jgi:hypothetical protein
MVVIMFGTLAGGTDIGAATTRRGVSLSRR